MYHIVEVEKDEKSDTPSNESDELENTIDVEEIWRENKMFVGKHKESSMWRSKLKEEVEWRSSVPVKANNLTVDFEQQIPRLLEPI